MEDAVKRAIELLRITAQDVSGQSNSEATMMNRGLTSIFWLLFVMQFGRPATLWLATSAQIELDKDPGTFGRNFPKPVLALKPPSLSSNFISSASELTLTSAFQDLWYPRWLKSSMLLHPRLQLLFHINVRVNLFFTSNSAYIASCGTTAHLREKVSERSVHGRAWWEYRERAKDAARVGEGKKEYSSHHRCYDLVLIHHSVTRNDQYVANAPLLDTCVVVINVI